MMANDPGRVSGGETRQVGTLGVGEMLEWPARADSSRKTPGEGRLGV